MNKLIYIKRAVIFDPYEVPMDKKNHWPKILYTNFIKKRAYSKDKNKIREREKKEKKEIEVKVVGWW